MTSERARPECDVRSRNALAAGTEQGSVYRSPVRHRLVALIARSVSIVTGRQPIEQLEGYDVIG